MIGRLREVINSESTEPAIQEKIAIKANNTNTAIDVLSKLLKVEDGDLSAYKVGDWLLSKNIDDMWKIVDVEDIVKWVKEDLASGIDLKESLGIGVEETPLHKVNPSDKNKLRLLDVSEYEHFVNLTRGNTSSVSVEDAAPHATGASNISRADIIDSREQTFAKQREIAERVKEIFNNKAKMSKYEIEPLYKDIIWPTTSNPKQGR